MDLISVIIPTYNRFQYLLNAIKSVKEQTYKNIEIIVVNDASTEPEYLTHNWDGVNIIHLPKNSRQVKGYPCVGYVRNQGIKAAKGNYIALLDDDDIFLPTKLQEQLDAMKLEGALFSSTDGYIGHGPYKKGTVYKEINGDTYKTYILRRIGESTFPKFIMPKHINAHNLIINSSVMLHKDLLKKTGDIDECHIKQAEDYKYWKRCIQHSNCLYINKPLMYYDNGHGGGHKW